MSALNAVGLYHVSNRKECREQNHEPAKLYLLRASGNPRYNVAFIAARRPGMGKAASSNVDGKHMHLDR